MPKEDEGIQVVRDVRQEISAEFDDDPAKLVEHYIVQQEQHRDRLLRSSSDHQTDATDRPSTGR